MEPYREESSQAPSMRASDQERDATVQRLQVAFAEGRLADGEFDERMRAALSARTHGDLDVLLTDLPTATVPVAPRPVTPVISLTANLPLTAGSRRTARVYSTSDPYGFDRLDPNSYNYSQQQTVFDSEGNAQSATLYSVRTGSIAAGDATDTWDVHMFVGDEEASATTGSPTPEPAQLGSTSPAR